MKVQFLAFSIIIICNIVFGCDPKKKDCHETSSTRPGVRKRGKRDPGSNLLEVSKGHGPYARFCNAMTIAYDLRYKINETIVPLAGELFNLDESMTNRLMSFDSNPISTLLDSLRDTLTLTKDDLDKIAEEMNKVKKLRGDFNGNEEDQTELKDQYNFINNVKRLTYEQYGNTANELAKLSRLVASFESTSWSAEAKTVLIQLGQDLTATISPINTGSGLIHDELVNLKNTRLNPSLFELIRRKGDAYNSFFETKHWSDAQDLLLNDGKVFQLLEFVERSEVREKSMQALNTIQNLIEVAEKEGLPKSFNRTWARAFVPGSSDLELFEKELNGPMFKDLFQSGEDFTSMRNGFKQVIRFGKAVTSSRSAIFEKAKVETLKDQVKELQFHLRKFDSVQIPEGYQSFAHLLNLTYNNPPAELDQSSFQTFTELTDRFKKAHEAQEKLIQTDQELEDSTEFKWLIASREGLNELNTLMGNIHKEDDFNQLKNDERFKMLKRHLPKLVELVSKVNTDAIALKNEIQGLEALKQVTPPINRIISIGFRMFTNILEDAPQKTLDVITLAIDHLGLQMEDYKNTFTDLHSSFVGEMNSIREKTESVSLPEDKDAIDLWQQFADRRLIEEKLIAGYLVFGYFHQALSRETELLLFFEKNIETWEEASNHSVPDEFFEKIHFPEFAMARTEQMFEELKELDQKIDSSKFADTRELENWGHEISLTDCPEIVVADWIEANKMLDGTTMDKKMAVESLNACKTVEDLNLDWAYHKSHAFTWIRGVGRLKNYLHLVYKVKKIYEKPKAPPAPVPLKKTHPKDPLLIIILLLVLIPTAYVASRVARYYTEKKYGKARRDFLAKKETVITTEIAAELKIEREDFHSIQEMYDYRAEVREIWHQKKADPHKVKLRLHFRRLLEEARDKGTPIETTIRQIAEQIQESYKEYRNPTRCQMEIGNYFCNIAGNMVTLPDRLFRILRNTVPSRKIWQFMTKRRFSILVDFQTLWYEDDQLELATDIRGKPNQYIVYWSEEIPNPFKNVEMRLVVRNRRMYEMLYMRYQNFPVGFAPFELTPCQVMYEMIDEMRDEDGDDNVAVVCIDRDGDSRSCILPMIDNMLHVMTHSDTFDDLADIGEIMAQQRLRSIDLVTTVQIEFCLYVCFKIINDESAAMKQPMFNEDKTEFMRQIEDAWASAWLRNYEKYEAHYKSQKMDRIYKPNDRDQHFYPQSKPHLEKMKETVIRMMERRRDYVMSKGEQDPYKKETKKEAEEKKKKQ